MNRRTKTTSAGRWSKWLAGGAGMLAAALALGAQAQTTDPLLNTLIKKGILTEDEAKDIKTEADASQSNSVVAMPPSKWKISDGIKSVELFGDLRFRYEYRSAYTPTDDAVTQKRYRYAFRVGLRGDLADDFYYGFRLDTAANPRSPWATFGSSTSGAPYQGPYGKSTASIYLGQIYAGWRPANWFDMTVGRMPQPLYTTSMVWDTDYNPEGAAEHFTYTVGDADFFANFGQFLYQEIDPAASSFGLLEGPEENPSSIVQFAWQGGLTYHIETNISAKIAATVYQYMGLQQSSASSGSTTSPYYGDVFIGEGAYTGPGSGSPINGASGYGTGVTSPVLGDGSLGYPLNQVGLNNLLVLEVPFEVNFKFNKLDARVFGDFAYNFQGKERAQAAATGYASYLAFENQTSAVTISGFAPQKNDVKAYQIGFAVGSKDDLGLVYGSLSHKNAWEFRTYWQHVEQYALDPNLLDSDFFEGRGNLEGIYAAFAYGFSDNMIGTVRGGYASRINDALGTGGSNQDVPWVNPINRYDLLQMDLTYRF